MAIVRTFLSEGQLDALREIGIEPADTVRVVIDIQLGQSTQVYVQRYQDEKEIDVRGILAGPVEVIRLHSRMSEAEVEGFKRTWRAANRGPSKVLDGD